jgi:hypothetical protein
MVSILLSHLDHEIVECDYLFDNMSDLFDGRLINGGLIALIDTEFALDAVRLDGVLQTEKSNINHKLLHVSGSCSALIVVDSQETRFLVIFDCIGGAEEIIAEFKYDFGRHLVSDTVIDISHKILIHRIEIDSVDNHRRNALLYELEHDVLFVVLVEFDTMLDMLAGNIMENRANGRQVLTADSLSQRFDVVIDPSP